MTKIDMVTELLYAYGEAIRGDWSCIDGRTVRDDLGLISGILGDKHELDTKEAYLDALAITKDKYNLYKWLD